ncbi:amidohydrolase [Sesbania bispinosa]|nr:amidohydrolase [Sesbania bispinosa]
MGVSIWVKYREDGPVKDHIQILLKTREVPIEFHTHWQIAPLNHLFHKDI